MEVGLSAASAMGRLCILLLLLGNAAAEVLPADVFQRLAPPPPPPHSTHQPEPAHGLTGEEKAWIAVGVSALAVAAVALLVYYCCTTGGQVQPPRAAEPRRAEIVVRMPPLDVRMA